VLQLLGKGHHFPKFDFSMTAFGHDTVFFSMLQLNAFAALSPLDCGSQHQLSLPAPHTPTIRMISE
jgi:hypothetical protein